MPRGAFIVFEGADRSGKTSQTHRLAAALRGVGIPLAADSPWGFPDRTTQTGQLIDAYLRNDLDMDDRALHLLFSANRWEKAAKIRQALQLGETVVLDRYAYSGVAYSAAKNLDIEWCKASDIGLPAPDAVIYLDLSPHIAAKKEDYGNERYENAKMQRAVVAAFSSLQTNEWRVVDADGDHDTVFARISDAVVPVIVTARESEMDTVGTLWS